MSDARCTDVVTMLDEFADGRLDVETTSAVRAHLDECAVCRGELARVRDLARAVRSMPRTIEPDRDLWPGIRDRIEARRVVEGRFVRRRPGAPPTHWKAIAAAAILVVSVVGAYLIGVERGRPGPSAGSGAGSDLLQARSATVNEDLESVVDEMRARLDARRDELPPETWSVVTDNLLVIDRAIQRIETALAEHPNDGRLNLQLAVAYRRQIDLLRMATTLPADVRTGGGDIITGRTS